MITLLHSSPRAYLLQRDDRWSALVACVVTATVFIALLATLALALLAPVARPVDVAEQRERITYVTSAPSRVPAPTPPAFVRPLAPLPSSVARDTGAANVGRSVPSSGTPPPSATSASPPAAPPPAPSSIGSPSSRLMPSRGTALLTPPVVFDPFAERVAPSPEVRDSLLRELRDAIATVAPTRAMSSARRDALLKDGAMRTHLLGRPQLDKPVGNGTYSGKGGGGISVPLFEPGPSRGSRVHDSVSFAENLARLERLRLRADSLRRARLS